jgi:ubiquinone biosynthesis accessory factor UbiJ
MNPKFMALSALEKAINTFLKLDDSARESLSPLANKTIQIDIKKINHTVYFVFLKDCIHVQGDCLDEADLIIKARPSQFIRLATSKTPDDILDEDDIEMMGDVVLAKKMQACFKAIHIDWASYLAKFVGEVGANEAEKGLKGGLSFAKKTLSRLKDNVVDYCQVENRILVTPDDIKQFSQEVADLRDAVERFNAKLNAKDAS